MGAITLLKDDHRSVEKLFKRFEKAGDRAFTEKRNIVERRPEGRARPRRPLAGQRTTKTAAEKASRSARRAKSTAKRAAKSTAKRASSSARKTTGAAKRATRPATKSTSRR